MAERFIAGTRGPRNRSQVPKGRPKSKIEEALIESSLWDSLVVCWSDDTGDTSPAYCQESLRDTTKRAKVSAHGAGKPLLTQEAASRKLLHVSALCPTSEHASVQFHGKDRGVNLLMQRPGWRATISRRSAPDTHSSPSGARSVVKLPSIFLRASASRASP
jgi:hypothetical protein